MVAFVALSGFGLSRLAARDGMAETDLRPLRYFLRSSLWFLLPAAISLIKGLEIPQNRYSYGRSRGDALGAIFVDHELLCAP